MWLFIHFGGPGLSNVDQLGAFREPLLDIFGDMVLFTFDQRGTGERYEPSQCEDAVRRPLLDPKMNLSEEAIVGKVREACGGLSQDVGVQGLVHDMESAVGVLRDRTETYFPDKVSGFGASYGGYAVAQISNELPHLFSQVVLDSPVTFLSPIDDYAALQVRHMRATAASIGEACDSLSLCGSVDGPVDSHLEKRVTTKLVVQSLRLASLSVESSGQMINLLHDQGGSSQQSFQEALEQYIGSSWRRVSLSAWMLSTCAARGSHEEEDFAQRTITEWKDILLAEYAACAEWNGPVDPPFELPPIPTLVILNDRDPVSDFIAADSILTENVMLLQVSHFGHGSVATDPCAARHAATFLQEGIVTREACRSYTLLDLMDVPIDVGN